MKLPIITAFCAGLMVSGLARADEIKINQTFSGVGHATQVDTNGDGAFASAFNFAFHGSPGQSTAQSMGEYTGFNSADCPNGLPSSHLVQQSFVQRFSDLSMLYYISTAGRTCFDPSTGEITCEIEGDIIGGSGRFEDATGSWAVTCEIFIVGQTVTATNGTLKGTANVPNKGRN